MPNQKQNLKYYIHLLYPFIKKDIGLLGFGLFAMLCTSALQLVYPLILANIVDKSIPSGNVSQMYRYGAMFIAAVLVSGALTYLQTILLSKLGVKVITKFKAQVFRHLLTLPVEWFNKQAVGELIARVESDAERVKALFSDLSIRIIGNLLFFIGIFLVMFLKEWHVAAYILPGIIVGVIAYYYLIKYLSKFYRQIREKNALVTAKITDYVQGVPIIQSLNLQNKVYNDLRNASDDKYKLETKTTYLEYGAQSFFMFLFEVFFIVMIIRITAPQILAGIVTLGTLIVFIDYTYRMIWPLMSISENVMQIQRSFVSLKRILELNELQSEDEIFTGKRLPTFEHEIRFENVWFAYNNEDWVLKDISFTIPKGKKIALVGPSGSGKTTTVSLLCYFYQAQKGQILVDGVPLSEIDFRAWRRKIGLILQDVFLFPGSILENVRVYNDAISEEKVKEAINVVQLDEFIQEQRLGLDTELAERGQNISQGEKQLISFARALAFDAEIIVMDEATASVDPQTEARIQHSMERVFANKTVVVVAHRLTTILDADEILFFDKGRIIHRGTHQQLLNESSEYRKLVTLQMIGLEDTLG
ncbi:MAG TPA: ABC transporter ATP-binding protein [Candidatus Syntrophosphaera thermopropionivorans]|jgi:ATP-binding cassette subfamily B protein|nr:ABC transporter ATP-binding protein [Candidatus Syntrophosphaera sp.]HOH82487.1 ABC transporter ATP-binding protein [Candidatus Syntrophosphaera thermopropionivorans]HOJ42400.1 ABC transporter ATP-binding protein [Candidatus Syntrophosphaera thermopropionivorans]HOL33699.1 ABC transporter ATP-binding protein [Candidatus Syntrophosphaera thermopropionivorans]HON32980.1 ABC transporter ATP-binding protein [Candidatus Syntrophosphaera thermopropionivorans]